MKYFLLSLTLSLSTLVLAQTDVENKLKKEMWVDCAPEFKATAIPDKWKNESAVIMALERKYVGDFAIKVSAKYYVEKLNVHFRIKLLDKAAVEDFSDLSFNDKTVRTNIFGRASAYRVVGIKVIKPNGTEKEVDLSQAVKTDASSSKELKIPIPNLEPGDILDYYVAFKDESREMPNFGDEATLEGKYPIIYNVISFSIPHQFTFNSFPQNGAPDFKKEVVKNDEIYTLRNSMQEKEPDIFWTYEYRTAPHVRYKISSSGLNSDPETSAERMMQSFSMGVNPTDVGILEDFIDINFKKEKDQKKIINELYLALRNPIYRKAYFQIDQSDPMYSGGTPNLFFFVLDKYLDRKKIAHDILLVPSRTYGPIQNAVNFSTCDLVMKVKTNPVIYIGRPNPFSLPNELTDVLEGTKGVTGKIYNSEDKMIPESTKEQNELTTSFQVTFDPANASKIKVKRNTLAKGHHKINHQYLVFTNYDYLKEYDNPKYQAESSRLMGGLIKEYNKEKQKFEQRKIQDYNERDKRLTAEIERDMDTKVSDYSITVKSIGMWIEKPNVEYDDEFTLENFTKKIGPNTIIELGKLIEKQTDVTDAQKDRTRDIYMDFARTFNQNITFTIPEGYTVEGLEAMNKKIENNTGGFISSAEVEGNMLVVKTKKYYNKNYFPAADWPKITEFLKGAVDFYGTKILLKKA